MLEGKEFNFTTFQPYLFEKYICHYKVTSTLLEIYLCSTQRRGLHYNITTKLQPKFLCIVSNITRLQACFVKIYLCSKERSSALQLYNISTKFVWKVFAITALQDYKHVRWKYIYARRKGILHYNFTTLQLNLLEKSLWIIWESVITTLQHYNHICLKILLIGIEDFGNNNFF